MYNIICEQYESDPLRNKNIILGVTGSVAAFKAVQLASTLKQLQCNVKVVLTNSASKLIAPIQFSAITHSAIYEDMWNPQSAIAMDHLELADWADLAIVYPATVNTISKIALGICDNTLTTAIVALNSPLIIVPAMDSGMWERIEHHKQSEVFKKIDTTFIGPNEGHLASGQHGLGRLADISELIDLARKVLSKKGILANKKVLITFGSTVEYIDPVRVLSSESSGKMGYWLAQAFRDLGAEVTNIIAKTSVQHLFGMKNLHARTSSEMIELIDKLGRFDIGIFCASVADFQPAEKYTAKIDRAKQQNETITIKFKQTVDVAKKAAEHCAYSAIFSAQTDDDPELAMRKMHSKNANFVIHNKVSASNQVIGGDYNKVTIYNNSGHSTVYDTAHKSSIAAKIAQYIVDHIKQEEQE